jgi:hypothetical protein
MHPKFPRRAERLKRVLAKRHQNILPHVGGSDKHGARRH